MQTVKRLWAEREKNASAFFRSIFHHPSEAPGKNEGEAAGCVREWVAGREAKAVLGVGLDFRTQRNTFSISTSAILLR